MSLTKTVRKRRRSLVCFLASCVPSFLWKYLFPVPPRMYISWDLIQKISSIEGNNFPPDDSNTSFCSFKQNINNRDQQQIFNSTPKKIAEVQGDQLKVLQEELLEIKKIVAKLMEKQIEECSGYGTLSNRSDQLQKSFIPPPPPPPPPPPMPQTNLLLAVNSPKKIEKKKSVTPQTFFPGGKELLKEIKKVQLKKIEKSPGGGPLKSSNKSLKDPGDILGSILKKRFASIQNSPDSSLDSLDTETSFDSGPVNNSFKTGKNNKIAVM